VEKSKSKGLGDDIAKLTSSLRLDKVAKRVAELMGKDDCGCEKRQEIVNEWVPYDKKMLKKNE